MDQSHWHISIMTSSVIEPRLRLAFILRLYGASTIAGYNALPKAR
jgi:hypothetical protein